MKILEFIYRFVVVELKHVCGGCGCKIKDAKNVKSRYHACFFVVKKHMNFFVKNRHLINLYLTLLVLKMNFSNI